MHEKVVQLRELLAGKFPGLRQKTAPVEEESSVAWPTGLSQIDQLLQGGLPRGALAEVIASRPGCGSALVLRAFVQQAAKTNQLTALIDGQDSFDPASLDNTTLSRLLWVRSQDATQALKAADFILRDRNMSVVLLDLTLNPPAQLRKIPSSTWFRLQRLVERTSTVCTVFSPFALAGSAAIRLSLHHAFGLEAFSRDANALLTELKFVVLEKRSAESETASAKVQAG
jgi:hypothetical protein